jgi:hypothetical protein
MLVLLLLMCSAVISCIQVMLDTAQLAAVLLSLDLALLLPDWAAAGASAILMSQATTWQWVPFECLLPSGSAASGAVLQSALVMLLPGK